MSFYTVYPPSGGVPTYPTFADFPTPATAGNGALAIALDTDILYISTGSIWEVIANPSGAGTVTSVNVTGGTTGLTTSGGPVTTSGVITLAGTLDTSNGGTGQTTAAAAYNALSPMTTTGDLEYESSNGTASRLPVGSSGQVLTVSGGVPAWAAPATSGTVTSVSVVSANGLAGTVANPTTAPALTLSTTVTGILQGNGTTISAATATGSGSVVLQTSPTLITPALGTPSGIVLTNATGLPLTTGVTGDLGIPNGGTGQTTAAAAYNALSPMTTTGDIEYESGTNTAARLPIGSTGEVLTVSGGVPIWASPATSGTVTSVSVVNTNGFAGTVANPTSTPALTIETTITAPVLAGNGTALIAGTTTGTGSTVVLSASPTLTGTTTTAALSSTTGSFSSAVNMNSNQVNNLANGAASGDAVNLGQLQSAIAGLTWKGPAQAYAASNVPLTGSTPLVIDGYTILNGDLLLLGNQTTTSQNGEYAAAITGGSYTLTANGLPNVAGDAWLVLNGTIYTDSAFVANAAVPAATFTEFAGPTAYTFSAPLSLSGRTVSITQATTSTNGYLSSTDWNTFNNKQAAGNYITALTGDATASGPGSAALTLSAVNANIGSFGSSTSIPSFTVNAKGLITAASGNAVVAPAGTLTGNVLASNVITSSLSTVGTIGTGVWQGTPINTAFGGTGATSAAAGFNNLNPMTTTGDIIYESATNVASRLPIGTTGNVLTVTGGVPTWVAPATSGTVTSVSVISANGLAGTVATATTTPAITLNTTVTGILQGNGTAISAASTTGSGAVVLSSSPTLTTPNLGTPSAITLTNATGYPLAASTVPGIITSYTPTIQNTTKTVTAGANYTITTTDGYSQILVTTGNSTNNTITLPAASANGGRVITITKVDNGSTKIIIAPTGTDAINGGTGSSVIIGQGSATNANGTGQGATITLVSDGVSAWSSISTAGDVFYTSTTGITPGASQAQTQVGSIILTAGTWLINATFRAMLGTATPPVSGFMFAAIDPNSGGAISDNFSIVNTPITTFGGASNLGVVPGARYFTVTSNTTVYLSAAIGYTAVGTMTYEGRMSALRV